jgi:hypothetical protein
MQSEGEEFVSRSSSASVQAPRVVSSIQSPEEILLREKTRFLEIFGKSRPGQNLAMRAALLKQSQRGLMTESKPKTPTTPKKLNRNFLDHNMRGTVLRSFRRTQRLRRIGAEAEEERQRQSAAKQHRSEIFVELIHEPFVKRRLNILRMEILSRNFLPAYRENELFRQALWTLHVVVASTLEILWENFHRRKRIKRGLNFPTCIQNYWRARQSLKMRRRKREAMARFLAATRIMRLLVRMHGKCARRRWGVSVLVSVLKTKKNEYTVKMYIRRFAVDLLKIQRWWKRMVDIKRARIEIMQIFINMYDMTIKKAIGNQVCNLQYSEMKRTFFENLRLYKKSSNYSRVAEIPKPRSFWLLDISETRRLVTLCRKYAVGLASELALGKYA